MTLFIAFSLFWQINVLRAKDMIMCFSSVTVILLHHHHHLFTHSRAVQYNNINRMTI